MAHAMSEQWVQLNDKDIEIQSRGIRVQAGEPTTAHALGVLCKAQIKWHGRSQPLLEKDLQWADYVWGMTQEHLDIAIQVGRELHKTSRPCYQLLAGDKELSDPLNAGLERYEELFDTLGILLPKRLEEV
jgi:protein-tyrosine-phosphatase